MLCAAMAFLRHFRVAMPLSGERRLPPFYAQIFSPEFASFSRFFRGAAARFAEFLLRRCSRLQPHDRRRASASAGATAR